MLRLGIAAWIAGGSSFLFLSELPKQGLGLCFAIILILGAVTYFLRDHDQHIKTVLLMLTLFAVGWTYYFYYAQSRLANPFLPELENQELRVSGTIDQLPNGNQQGQRFSFRVNQWHELDRNQLPERIYLSWSNAWGKKQNIPELIPGQEWQFLVKLKRPHTMVNPHGFDFERWMFHQGMGAHGSVRSAELLSESSGLSNFKIAIEYQRWRIRKKIKEALAADAKYAGVLIALVIGDQNSIAQEDWRVFNATGVGHLISISGLHVTMLSGLGATFGAWLWRRRGLPLRVPVQKMAACAGLLTAFLYAWLAGFQIPAQRTMYMVGVVAIALWTGRIVRAFDIWWLALLLVLMIDPMAAYTPGFWLSFAAVAIILYGMGASSSLIGIPNGRELETDRTQRFILALKESCRLQWIVTIALLPCTLYWFYQVSIASPIANALAIPIISFVVTPLAITGALLPDWAAHPVLHLAHFVMELTAQYLNWLAQLNWAVLWSHQPTLWAVALSTLGVYLHIQPGPLSHQWLLRIFGIVLLAPLFWAPNHVIQAGEFRASVFDIGQGTAVLIETKSHRLLYDAGPIVGKNDNAGERTLIPYFRGEGIRHLDRLVISHKDADHIGGASSVMDALQIESFLGVMPENHPFMQKLIQQSIPALPCQYGQEWQWDGVQFKVWHPSDDISFAEETHRGKPNENSCVLEVNNGYASFWLTGDIEKRGEREHAQRLKEERYQSPQKVIVMAPHHGSKTSSSADWLETLKPSATFSQHGYLNRYGHPHPTVKQRYDERGIDLLETPETGAQIWYASANDLVVDLLRPLRKRLWHHDE